MSQEQIIQEQMQANERIIKSVRTDGPGVKGQAPANERVTQIERKSDSSQSKTQPKK